MHILRAGVEEAPEHLVLMSWELKGGPELDGRSF